MPLCPACLKKYDAASVLEQAAAELLPPNIELYDFGGGLIVAPVPDIPREGARSYLTSHMAALVSHSEKKILAFEIKEGTWQKSAHGNGEFSEGIVNDLKRALTLWPTAATSEWSQAFRRLV
jgi:hypothetical protein